MPFKVSNYGRDTKVMAHARSRWKNWAAAARSLSSMPVKAPMTECHFASYSDDVADIAQTLRAAFDLSGAQAAIRFGSAQEPRRRDHRRQADDIRAGARLRAEPAFGAFQFNRQPLAEETICPS